MTRASLIAAGGLALVLAGCAATPPADGGTVDGPRQCDAAQAQSLIGSHVGAVDFGPGSNVRIVCTTCATTKEYMADRLNLRFDEATGIIQSVDCG